MPLQTLADRIIARLDKHHPASARHSERVAERIALIAEALADPRLPTPAQLYHMGRMHDAGKIWIVKPVLTWPGKLDEFQWAYMTEHAAWGEFVLRQEAFRLGIILDERAVAMAVSHHEQWGGGGYPRGLAGEAIPLVGRLCSFADVFDACTSRRSYRVPMTQERALEELQRGVGTQFEPALAAVVLPVLAGQGPVVRVREVRTA